MALRVCRLAARGGIWGGGGWPVAWRGLCSAKPEPFILADIGEGIAEVELLQWFVKPGDAVDQFDRLCEVQSDKATVEISSPYVGKVESLAYDVGAIAKVGTPLLYILKQGSEKEAAGGAPAAASPAKAVNTLPPTAPRTASTSGKVLATPATRALAKQHGLDLSTLVGTGREGRVTKEDVLVALDGSAAPAVALPVAPGAAATVAAPPALPRPVRPAAADYEVPIRGIRKAMYAQMTAANAVPHFGYCDEVRMDELMAVRQQLKAAAAEVGLPKFTLIPLIVRATSLALAQHPELNGSISEGELALRRRKRQG
eukprot:scaffold25603_cov30-Tisochrysis_lutea.AAC.1